MSELPKGWAETLIPECVYFQEGPGLRKWMFSNEGMPFLNIRTFENGRINKCKCQHISMKEFTGKYEHFLLNEGDIVVSSSGSLGKVVEVRKEDLPVMLNTSVIRYRTLYPDLLSQNYIRYYVQSPHFYKQIHLAKTGSAILNYGPSHLKQMSIVIPPPNEQKRIVEKLDKLLAKVEEAKSRLDKIPVIIKRFRQSVLNAAVTGELTKDWRERNEIDDNSWIENSIGEVITDLRYGTAKALIRDKVGNPTIRIPNIDGFYLNTEDLKYTNLTINEYEKLKLEVGDILVIRSNGSVGLVGKSSIVREIDKDLVFAGYLIRIRVDNTQVNPDYLNFVLHSISVRDQIEIPARSTSGVNNINSEEVKAIKFLLPTILDEQKEIVKRVETLFKKADEIEERYKKANAFVDKLTQSILAKAFRGELVPQDPNDEPASVLLERIKIEKEKLAAEKKSKKTK